MRSSQEINKKGLLVELERKLIKISFYRNFAVQTLISGFKAPGSAVVLPLFFIQNVSTEDAAANMTLQGAHFRQEATPMQLSQDATYKWVREFVQTLEYLPNPKQQQLMWKQFYKHHGFPTILPCTCLAKLRKMSNLLFEELFNSQTFLDMLLFAL